MTTTNTAAGTTGRSQRREPEDNEPAGGRPRPEPSERRRTGVPSIPVILAAGVALAALMIEPGARLIGAASVALRINLGWLYVLGVTAFLVFLLWLACGRHGRVRLGDRPTNANVRGGRTVPRGWYAMLLAGTPMGAMLLLAGAAEPLANYQRPPRADVIAGSVEAAEWAMNQSLFHFGLHAWAVFCLPTLAFAYFGHRRGLPFRVSSLLHPVLGKRIHGPIGRGIDLLALTAATLGTAALLHSVLSALSDPLASLPGLSSPDAEPTGTHPGQPSADPLPLVILTTLILLLVVLLVVGSAAARRRAPERAGLAGWRLGAGAIGSLLVFGLLSGSLSFLANGTAERAGGYLDALVSLSFWTDAFADSGWLANGTVPHWTWLITIAPYVGIAVARVSAGFTIRRLVLGMLAVPTAFGIVWFGVYGLSAIESANDNDIDGSAAIALAPGEGSGVFFWLLNERPGGPVLAVLAAGLLLVLVASTVYVACTAVATASGTDRPAGAVLTWAVLLAAATVGFASARPGAIGIQDLLVVVGFPLLLVGLVSMYALVLVLRTKPPEVPQPPAHAEPSAEEGVA